MIKKKEFRNYIHEGIPQRNINAHAIDYYKEFTKKELINTMAIMFNIVFLDSIDLTKYRDW